MTKHLARHRFSLRALGMLLLAKLANAGSMFRCFALDVVGKSMGGLLVFENVFGPID